MSVMFGSELAAEFLKKFDDPQMRLQALQSVLSCASFDLDYLMDSSGTDHVTVRDPTFDIIDGEFKLAALHLVLAYLKTRAELSGRAASFLTLRRILNCIIAAPFFNTALFVVLNSDVQFDVAFLPLILDICPNEQTKLEFLSSYLANLG